MSEHKFNELVQELDRNMDSVFDNLYVLNAAMTAMVNALEPAAAAETVRHLDQSLGQMLGGQNPPGFQAIALLRGWRNMAATAAGTDRQDSEA